MYVGIVPLDLFRRPLLPVNPWPYGKENVTLFRVHLNISVIVGCQIDYSVGKRPKFPNVQIVH